MGNALQMLRNNIIILMNNIQQDMRLFLYDNKDDRRGTYIFWSLLKNNCVGH